MNSNYYRNESCEYFPCHDGIEKENFNCMFCYCPLYALKNKCGGNFSYTSAGIKDCSNCKFPHKKENYDLMIERVMLLVKLTRKSAR